MAMRAPEICAIWYGITSLTLNLPDAASAIVIAGLKCPCPFDKKRISVNAAPMAIAFPVAKIT